ncbi:MAG: hypothetical protein WA740_16790 [Candidatus Binataceae bacterium]
MKRSKLRLFSAVMLSLLAARSLCARAQVAEVDAQAGSGIYGRMVRAWGNPPANSTRYQCVKVLDDRQRKTIALGECSGSFAQFRVPLPPGHYVVEYGGRWESVGGKARFVANRYHITVTANRWIDLSPPASLNPVP